MALDAAFLSYLKNEINTRLEGSRVDKVHQPEKDEIDIVLRLKNGNARLLVSSNPNSPRVHFTTLNKENPMQPPMFCMLLRKHLSGAKWAGARQPDSERIIFLDFLSRNELGDEVKRTVAVEIMGKYSNIILIDENNRIIDSVKHVDLTMSRERQILPGLQYELPPMQEKLSINKTPADAIAAKIREGKDLALSKSLLSTVKGISPIVCREWSFLTCGDSDKNITSLDNDEFKKLSAAIESTRDNINAFKGTAVMVTDTVKRKPIDFSFMGVNQYGDSVKLTEYSSFSELLDAFYTERDIADRIYQRTHDMVNLINGVEGRISRKLANQKIELEKSKDREHYRICGDLVSANLYRIEKGATSCTVANFYEEDEPQISIKLDPALTPSKNAQKYYHEYRKASAAEKHLKEQLAEGEEELTYLNTVIFELSHAQSDSSISEIRAELAGEGYLKKKGKDNSKQSREIKPLSFVSSDGFKIWVGRNNRQNDKLTLKTAGKNDVWLHTKNIPGAHVIIFAEDGEVPDSTITEAAILAAFHSKAKDSSQVPVDYTLARYVKKPAGAKPGMVIYVNNKTAYVNPDAELVSKLKM